MVIRVRAYLLPCSKYGLRSRLYQKKEAFNERLFFLYTPTVPVNAISAPQGRNRQRSEGAIYLTRRYRGNFSGSERDLGSLSLTLSNAANAITVIKKQKKT